jgi:Lrp/AsnC family leucine-responsive transcriptional regulator
MGRQAIMPAKSKCRLDDINMQILMILNTNGRITATELADRLHVSRPAIHRRIKRMEEYGIIRHYTVEIDWKRIEPAGEDDDGI